MSDDKKQSRRGRFGLGFVVESGRMTSLGSAGATFIGHNSTVDVSAYRSPSRHRELRYSR